MFRFSGAEKITTGNRPKYRSDEYYDNVHRAFNPMPIDAQERERVARSFRTKFKGLGAVVYDTAFLYERGIPIGDFLRIYAYEKRKLEVVRSSQPSSTDSKKVPLESFQTNTRDYFDKAASLLVETHPESGSTSLYFVFDMRDPGVASDGTIAEDRLVATQTVLGNVEGEIERLVSLGSLYYTDLLLPIIHD